jgi:hypothetical protein
MTSMWTVFVPIPQSSNGAPILGSGGNIGRAARMNHEDIQHGGTMGWGKGHFNVSPRPLTASRGNTHRSVTGLITACKRRDAAETFLPVGRATRAVPTQAIATHGLVDVAALDITNAIVGGDGDMWGGASGTRAVVRPVDEVSIRDAVT